MFNEFKKDKVTLVKISGEKYENIPADVQTKLIFLNGE